VLVLVPAIAYGLARLAIWYHVKDGVDRAQESLAPFASLEYERILSPVFGAFGVTGITIEPHAIGDRVDIGSALVHMPDPIEKFHYLRASTGDSIPQRFNFSLNAIRVPFDGEIASWFNTAAAFSATPGEGPAACGSEGPLTFSDLQKMGYEELVAHVALDYAYDRRSGGVDTYVRVELEDMLEIVLEGRIPASQVVFAADRMQGVPQFSDLSMTLRDQSVAARFNQYCADALGISADAYVEQSVRRTRDMLMESGFEPSGELLAALEKFTRGAAPITISFNPRDPVNVAALDTGTDPERMIDALGIEVLVDGTPVPSLGSVSRAPQAEAAAEASRAVIDETYKPTPVPELPQFLSSRVRIFTKDGKVHEGWLESVGAESLVLTRHLAGGSATFNVSRGEIDTVLVLRP